VGRCELGWRVVGRRELGWRVVGRCELGRRQLGVTRAPEPTVQLRYEG
jgi:hypothetical protein